VIGGGVAGLSCARRLQRAGRSVVVFDKGRRPGGRVSTRRAGGLQFDHGAQFFTARDDRFMDFVREALASGLVARWRGPFATLESGARGEDPRAGAERYVGAPGMSGLAHGLSEGLDVRSGAQVQGVSRRRGGFWLDLDDGDGRTPTSEGPYDAVAIATPPQQAVSLLKAHGGDVLEVAEGLAGALLPSLCAMVAFEESVAGAAGGMFIVADEALSWAAHDGGKPGRGGAPTYVLHGTAEWSRANFEVPPQEFAESLVAAFARALGAGVEDLPSVIFLSGHRWGYALAAGDAPPAPFVLESSGLGLCGDALGGGRVEGAYLSGLELGDALLSS